MYVFRKGCKVSISSTTEPDLSVLMSDDPLMRQSLEMREKRNRRPGYKISIGSLSTDVTEVFLVIV